MASSIEPAGQGLLTASLSTLYTVPSNRKFLIKSLTFGNFSGGALTLTVEALQSSTGTQRRYIERTVNDNDSDLAPELINQALAAGGLIQASGSGLTYLLTGILVNA